MSGDTAPTALDDDTKLLLSRREKAMVATEIFYETPLHLVRGEGVWLYDAKGRAYLDCYNNVASVGHCHPKVLAALTHQASRLNTHTRYLHENVVAYAEKLTGLMPEGLDATMFVCSGTEANELAMRIARTVTGHKGIIVSNNAYHGNSTLVHELSTCKYDPKDRPSYVATTEAPNPYRGSCAGAEDVGGCYAELVEGAIDTLVEKGHGVAAFLSDGIYDSEGIIDAPKDYFKQVYKKVRDAGGLCVADEVQAGLCRTGTWWGFEAFEEATPDIVTLGKPMGDGHPLAVVVTSRAIADAFAKKARYFNTFGGNPVSAAVGLAVLDVCMEQNLAKHCKNVGVYLKDGLDKLAKRHEAIGYIHGRGLFLGVELVEDRLTKKPATSLAQKIPDRMRQEGVLMGTTGPYNNILKIRPPLVFDKENTNQLLQVLDKVLAELV